MASEAVNILHMPVEVVQKIFSFCPDSSTQYNIPLTCKAFEAIGKQTLGLSYDNIDFTCDGRARAKRSLASYRNAIWNHGELASRVKNFTLGGLEERSFDEKPKTRMPADPRARDTDRLDQYSKLTYIIGRLPNLETLELVGDFGSYVQDWVLNTLVPHRREGYPLPDLTRLREFRHDAPLGESVKGVELLLSRTKAESIALTPGSRTAASLGWNYEAKNTTVRHLELNGNRLRLGTLDDALGNCTGVESLVLDEGYNLLQQEIQNPRSMATEDLQSVLNKHQQSIKKLSIGRGADWHAQAWRNYYDAHLSFGAWDGLEELTVWSQLLTGYTDDSIILERLMFSIPQSIRKLRLMVRPDTALTRMLQSTVPCFSPRRTGLFRHLTDFAVVVVLSCEDKSWHHELKKKLTGFKIAHYMVHVTQFRGGLTQTRKFGPAFNRQCQKFVNEGIRKQGYVHLTFSPRPSWYSSHSGKGNVNLYTDHILRPVSSRLRSGRS